MANQDTSHSASALTKLLKGDTNNSLGMWAEARAVVSEASSFAVGGLKTLNSATKGLLYTTQRVELSALRGLETDKKMFAAQVKSDELIAMAQSRKLELEAKLAVMQIEKEIAVLEAQVANGGTSEQSEATIVTDVNPDDVA